MESQNDIARIKIGVMGSAGGAMEARLVERCIEMGRAIADCGCAIVTGGCPGLPHYAVIGCKQSGGLTIGVSPAISQHEHVAKYSSPTDHIDVLIFTGMGLMGREVIGVRSCDIIIIVGGRSGTLGEFAIAYDEGRLIGVLTGSGGVADHVDDFLPVMQKPTGSRIIYDSDPRKLIERCVADYKANPTVIREREASK
ncbi:MAG: LOG family protein [Candidatus Hydrogenedentes bacterium]|nr:LOG family protein [Candidatus Hydrogenedentota bacterium]